VCDLLQGKVGSSPDGTELKSDSPEFQFRPITYWWYDPSSQNGTFIFSSMNLKLEYSVCGVGGTSSMPINEKYLV
jgi:hypothetical protein